MITGYIFRCQLKLHRLGDLAYRLWSDQSHNLTLRSHLFNSRYVLECCCSRAERAVAWRTAEIYNRTINTVSGFKKKKILCCSG